MGVGVVGTARFKKNWPQKEIREVTLPNSNFNDFFWAVDEHGTLVARWVDNGLVFCVSTLHKVGKKVKRMRKRPRKTLNNKRHVDSVWGDKGKVEIFIPTLIDDYKHWMGGVDLVDQRISYYHPNLRCQRNWIPIYLQLLSIVRNNLYLIHQQHYKKSAESQKQFTFSMIKELMSLARMNSVDITSKRHSNRCEDKATPLEST